MGTETKDRKTEQPFDPEAFLAAEPALIAFLDTNRAIPPFAYFRETGEIDDQGQFISELRVIVGTQMDGSTPIPVEVGLQEIQEAQGWFENFSTHHRDIFYFLAGSDKEGRLPSQSVIGQRLFAIQTAIDIPGNIVPFNS